MIFKKCYLIQGFPSGSADKESACNAGDTGDLGDPGSIPGSGRSPGGGNGNPLQYSCLENPHGQKSLAGYSPCRHKEPDTTEWLNTQHTPMQCMARSIGFVFLISLFI